MELYQDVILKEDMPAGGLCAGDVGVVVELHIVPTKEVGYSVEFFDMTGRTVAVIIVPEHRLRLPTPTDRPSTRQFAAAD